MTDEGAAMRWAMKHIQSVRRAVASDLQHPKTHQTLWWLLLDHMLIWLPSVALFALVEGHFPHVFTLL
jgi:hypothetical protein